MARGCPEKRKAWHRDYKKFRRQKIKDYLGGKCVGCGTTENLQFDHIDRHQKKFTISTNVNMAWDKLTEEADKCQLLCKECHKKKTAICHDASHLAIGYRIKEIIEEGDEVVVRLSRH